VTWSPPADPAPSAWTGWRAATERALYGEHGFYRRTAPARHFRTSVHASPRFAAAWATLLERVDAALGHPAALDVIDVGAGRAELLIALRAAVPAELGARIRWTAVERADRPDDLPLQIGWTAAPPERITGLVIANEWLDNVPVDVVELTGDGPRLVLVDAATGAERLGPVPDPRDLAWLERWWPLHEPGDRAEVGRPRDDAWADVVRRLDRGLAVAVDYAHSRADRPPAGTLAGHRDGRGVPPVPDGTCDVTAHVALDACAAAAERAGATAGWLTTQRAALRALGLSGARPDATLARSEPGRYLRERARASEEGELLDPRGLGGFGWLAHGADLDPGPVMGVTMRE
jgi:SAM-dependent MidA family methyltransferase